MIEKVIKNLVYEYGKDTEEFRIGYCYTGEPLLDFPAIKRLLRIVKTFEKKTGKNFILHFLTNGTILTDEMLLWLTKLYKEINISIDGSQFINDQQRIFLNGEGTFKLINSNIKKLKKYNMKLKANAVITKLFPKPKEICLDLIKLGFDEILIKPVRWGTEYSFDETNLNILKEGYQEYFELFEEDVSKGEIERICKYKNDFVFRPLKRILLRTKVQQRCEWGLNNLTINALGDFYPCDSATGYPELKVGDIINGLNWDKFKLDVKTTNRNPCYKCNIRNICGGSCYINSWKQYKNILRVDPIECEFNRIIIDMSFQTIFKMIEKKLDMGMLCSIFE